MDICLEKIGWFLNSALVAFFLQNLYFPFYLFFELISHIEFIKQFNINNIINDNYIYPNIVYNFIYYKNNFTNYKINTYGDNINLIENKNDLIISNHRTRADFFFTENILRNKEFYKKIQFIINIKYKNLPIVSTASILNDYFFLEKDYDKDKTTLDRIKTNYDNSVIVLYPEGRFLTYNNIKQNLDYCHKNNIESNKNVLTPKYKGLYHIVNLLKKKGNIGSFYDFTILFNTHNINHGYTNPELVSKKHTTLDVYIKKIEWENVPSNPDDFKTWLCKLYKFKSELMDKKDSWGQKTDVSLNDKKKYRFNFAITTFLTYYYIFMIITNRYCFLYMILSIVLQYCIQVK